LNIEYWWLSSYVVFCFLVYNSHRTLRLWTATDVKRFGCNLTSSAVTAVELARACPAAALKTQNNLGYSNSPHLVRLDADGQRIKRLITDCDGTLTTAQNKSKTQQQCISATQQKATPDRPLQRQMKVAWLSNYFNCRRRQWPLI
jgi:hypothetical protein